MKLNTLFVAVLATICCFCFSCERKNPGSPSASTKAVLLKQLKSTHTQKEWFVPVNIALEGVTPEQAMWRDSSGNHSIGQLAYHLLFWNKRQLRKFNGEDVPGYEGDNAETFTAFDSATWDQTVSGVDSVLSAFEKAIEASDEEKLKDWYETLANISVHNAYHTGQILYIRKLQKSWDPDKGVK